MIDISVWLTIIFRLLAAKLITMKAKFYILTKIEFIVYWELYNHSTVLSTIHLIRHHERIWFWYSIDKLKIINSPQFFSATVKLQPVKLYHSSKIPKITNAPRVFLTAL